MKAGSSQRVIWILIAGLALVCVAFAVSRRNSAPKGMKLFEGQVVQAYFPIEWTIIKGPPQAIEDYAVPAVQDRGAIYLGDLFEQPDQDLQGILNSTHDRYVKSGIARSDVEVQKLGDATYMSFSFKPKARQYETYTKGFLTFPSGRSVRVTTVRLDSDATIGPTIDSIIATVKQRPGVN